MKKALYLGFAALAGLSLFSCQKETGINAPEKNLITVTLTADKAGDETRAAAVEGDSKVTYEWTSTDKTNLKLFSVTTTTKTDDEGKKTTSETLTEIADPTITISSDNKLLTITATVEENTTLRAVVAGEMTNSSNKPKVKTSQSPAVDNFDPSTDVLIADDVTVSEVKDLALTFRRKAVVNKMTLKNMVDGEKVDKVIISSESYLTGYYEYSTGEMKGQNKEITVDYENVAVGASQEFPVYFVTMPGAGLTLTVVVKTDKYTYTKTFGNGAINFNLGSFTKFGVNLSGCGEEVVDVNYSGEWIIAGTHSDNEIAATAWTSGNFYPASIVSLDAENEVVTVKGETAPYKMTISRISTGDYAGLYTIVDANGNYLSATGAKDKENYLAGKETPEAVSYWSIEKNTDGTYNIIAEKAQYSNHLRVNYNNGNPRVSCYASSNTTQPKAVLYPFANIAVDETPVESYEFKKVSTVTSGKQYLIVGYKNSKYYVANPIASNKTYAYLASTVVTPSDDIITLEDMTNAFTIATSGEGYSIKQSDDRYLYASGNYNTINVGATSTSVWSIAAQTDATFNIASEGTYIQFGQGTYTTFGRWSSLQDGAVLPTLYEYQDGVVPVVLESIAITTEPTTKVFYVGEEFTFDGKVTATYDDGTTKEVTATVSTAPDMTTTGTQTVTLSYTEGDVTATTSYEITVNPKPVISFYETTKNFSSSEWNSIIQYELKNPIDEQYEVSCASDAEWLTVKEFEQNGDRLFWHYNVAKNTGAERTGHLTFTYPHADPVVVTVIQEKSDDYVEPEKTLKTAYLETFGSTTSNTVFASYSGYSATAAMFTTSGDVKTHYSGAGSVGKNNLSGVNLSSGYTEASGLSGCYQQGSANTESTILQISDINIEGYEELSVSFGALGGSTEHKINVSYIVDNGTEIDLITDGELTNKNWTLLSGNISATGKSLTLIFKHTPSKGWLIRMDDIKVTGKK